MTMKEEEEEEEKREDCEGRKREKMITTIYMKLTYLNHPHSGQ